MGEQAMWQAEDFEARKGLQPLFELGMRGRGTIPVLHDGEIAWWCWGMRTPKGKQSEYFMTPCDSRWVMLDGQYIDAKFPNFYYRMLKGKGRSGTTRLK